VGKETVKSVHEIQYNTNMSSFYAKHYSMTLKDKEIIIIIIIIIK